MLSTCVLLLLCASLVTADAEKRAELSPMPFVLGSRYGRSPPRMLAPRNDRYDKFFMGSRYGKRAEGPVASGHTGGTGGAGVAGALLCEFTGVYSLYRCVAPSKYDTRRIEEPRLSEED